MPWTVVNGDRVFDPPPDSADCGPGPDAWFRRLVVEYVEMHRYCPRKACRRLRECRSPTLACYDEAEPVLREAFFPRFREFLRQQGEV